MNKEITIFICENEEVRKEIIRKHFEGDKVTYVNIVSANKRDEIIKAIEAIEDLED